MDSIMISDADIQRVKGIDAVQYLMFQRYILFFLTCLSIVCLLVVLPINLQGNLRESSCFLLIISRHNRVSCAQMTSRSRMLAPPFPTLEHHHPFSGCTLSCPCCCYRLECT